MSHVVMLLSNAFRPDPRVAREAKGLAQAGHRVTVVSWDREARLAPQETLDGYQIERVQNVRAVYGAGARQILNIPRFWWAAANRALALQPNVIHCHDLDTLPAGWWLKARTGAHLVYDAHEHYPALMSLYLPSLFVSALVRWERSLMRHVDATITASTVLRDEFLARGIQPVLTLGNYQDTTPYTEVSEAQVVALRSQLGVSPGDLLVAYIGGFSRNRMLLPLVEAAAQLPYVDFHLWGDGLQRTEVEQAVARQPNAHYHGWLSPADLPRHFKAADIVYYCLRLDYAGAVYNAPNTLSHAMVAGRPVIANDVGDLGRIVRDAQCGVLISEATPQAIVGAVEQLCDPLTRTRAGTNGLQAAHNKYNAATIQRQLVDFYQKLLR